MILASGARGPEFDSQIHPRFFLAPFFLFFFPPFKVGLAPHPVDLLLHSILSSTGFLFYINQLFGLTWASRVVDGRVRCGFEESTCREDLLGRSPLY